MTQLYVSYTSGTLPFRKKIITGTVAIAATVTGIQTFKNDSIQARTRMKIVRPSLHHTHTHSRKKRKEERKKKKKKEEEKKIKR